MTQTEHAAPPRTLDQRMTALKRANDIRTRRARLKEQIKETGKKEGKRRGKEHTAKLLTEVPDFLETCKVFDLLLATPSFGRVKTNRLLNQCRISPSKTMGGLSERQRRELAHQMLR